jgi:hypothetical protein
MLPHHNKNFCWYDNLEDAKPHFTPVKVFSILQFFSLKPRASVLSIHNIIPLAGVKYAYKDPKEEKYFLKRYRDYTYEEMVHSVNEDVRVLRVRINASQVWLMLTLQNIADTTAMLKRVWDGHYSEKGKLEYRDFIALLKLSLQYEEYKDTQKSLTGYRTVCKQMEDQMKFIWDNAWANRKGGT